ncbi:hypothetical protein BJX68DRAFT_8549 [Aspergillus pseudodeflectus]|uniref:Uncharacterized protein n=1 Tax=Aspergillus pseudodeflectus TaxID=176178 RepID=A0ABR4LDW1_9EURO
MEVTVRGTESASQWTLSLRQEAEADRPFRTKNDLACFLENWMGARAPIRDLGDVHSLYELLQQLGLDHQRELRSVLDGLDFSTDPGSSYSRLADAFAPITLTPAIYLIHTILDSRRGRAKIDEASRTAITTTTGRQKYEIEVVRDSLIWLNGLLSLGEGSAKILLGVDDYSMQAMQVLRIKWLGSPSLKRRYAAGNIALTETEKGDLKALWRMFEQHQSVPVQYAFDLARLKIRGGFRFEWVKFHDATDGLTSDCPNIFESKRRC